MTKTITKYGMFGIAAIAALLMISVIAYNAQTAIAAPANKTMIGEYHLVAIPNTATWTTIVEGTIKTSTPSDLIVTHNQECAIHTGLNLDNNEESATSAIREEIRLMVDGAIVPATFGDPHEGDPDQFGLITMCGRAYHIDTNVLSTVFQLCGLHDECTETEIFFDSYIRTKQAHSWSWIVLDVGSGEHTVEVQAKLTKALESISGQGKTKGKSTDSTLTSECTDSSKCVDTILELGKRNLIVVEDKLATFQTMR